MNLFTRQGRWCYELCHWRKKMYSCFKPEANMSAVGNLTLSKPLCAHFGLILRCPRCVCVCVCVSVSAGHRGTFARLPLLKTSEWSSAHPHRIFMSLLLEDMSVRERGKRRMKEVSSKIRKGRGKMEQRQTYWTRQRESIYDRGCKRRRGHDC